jgi:predicted alpha/beta-hydrolase family hydrolase
MHGVDGPFRVPVAGGDEVGAIGYPAEGSRLEITLVLAHGAGADQHSGFMTAFARALAARGLDVVTFNFPYMERRRRAPDRADVLEACYASVIARVLAAQPAGGMLAIGGKSMGGRIASHLAAEPDGRGKPVAALVLLGYPLHPPGRPDMPRVSHLSRIRAPALIVQGSRDTFGTPDELRPVIETMPADVELFEIPGGDHSFKVRAGVGVTQADVYSSIQDRIAGWLAARRGSRAG